MKQVDGYSKSTCATTGVTNSSSQSVFLDTATKGEVRHGSFHVSQNRHGQHRDDFVRVREVMRAQQDEFQTQVAELHRLMRMQRDILRSRGDLGVQVIEAYRERVKEG